MGSPMLYVPNLIDYIRLLLLVIVLYVKSVKKQAVLLILSDVLDLLDGYIARLLKQMTILGQILDMVVDRISSTIISILIIQHSPQYLTPFTLLIVIDISAHWLRHVCGFILKSHHKEIITVQPLLNLYYQSKILLTLLCFCYQGFLISFLLYINGELETVSKLFCSISFIPLILKVWISILQGWEGLKLLSALECEKSE
eukprot:EST43143.1 CDP-diacylglycerol-inositol 3-phosphatidyltransferase [Spironucleus salmonicida]